MGTMLPFFLVALIVSVIGVGVPALFNAMLSTDSRKTVAASKSAGYWITVILATAASVLMLTLIYWKGSMGVYGPFPFFWEISLLPLVAAIIAIAFEAPPVSVIIPVLELITAGGYWFFAQSDVANSLYKAKLAEVEVVEESGSPIDEIDQRQMNLITESMAKQKLDGALTKITLPDGATMGSRYKVGELTKCSVRGEFFWVAPLEFDGWRTWRKAGKRSPGFLRVSAKDPFAEAEAVSSTNDGAPLQMIYLESACWEFDAHRHLRLQEGFLGKIFMDWTFECDENDRPYYTVSIVERHFGWGGYTVGGVAVFDVQTGEVKIHKPEEAPEWIDRIQPVEVISDNLDSWGMYSKIGWWDTIMNKGFVKKQTPGWYVVETGNGQTAYFTGWTSANPSEHAIIGYSLTDSRSGKTRFYPTNGGYDEVRAREVAGTLWTKEMFSPATDMTVCNIFGTMTYSIPMERNGVFSGVSLVMLKNYMVSARGATPDEAFRSYRAKLSTTGMEVATPAGSAGSLVKLQGKVARVGVPVVFPQTGVQLFPFMLDSLPGALYSPSHGSTWEAAFLAPGQTVAVTFHDVGDSTRVVETFDILDF